MKIPECHLDEGVAPIRRFALTLHDEGCGKHPYESSLLGDTQHRDALGIRHLGEAQEGLPVLLDEGDDFLIDRDRRHGPTS